MTADTIEKVDLVKLRPQFFRGPRHPEVVDLPAVDYLVIDGVGTPGGPEFQRAVADLYGVAYSVKMASKEKGRDFKVPTFGASWWVGTGRATLPREKWRWRLMIMMPDFITFEDVAHARATLARKRKSPEAPVRLEEICQGLCVQAMHVGPYDAEQETLDHMEGLMAEEHLRRSRPHHEVYLSDPRRTKPEKLKTLLRLPVEKTS